MLSMSSYEQEYVDGCRAKLDAQLTAYRALARTADAATREAFEPGYLATLVTLLDGWFVHRMRAKEGKDGNPLNEVRLLCVSIMTNEGVMVADRSIRYKAENSVTGIKPGDPVTLTEPDFRRLAEAFFTELRTRYA